MIKFLKYVGFLFKMRIDFFIHPEYGFERYGQNKNYKDYIKNLTNVFNESELPVLVKGRKNGNFDNQFSIENTLESIYLDLKKDKIQRGEIIPRDWNRLKEFVDEADEFKVHGSYYGECLLSFSVQLFAYLHRNEHWHNWLYAVPKISFKREKDLRLKHELNGDFKKSNLKYGIVLRHGEEMISSINEQLTDKETVIYNV